MKNQSAEPLTVYTKFENKPTQGWLPETHIYLTLTYKLTPNTRHTTHWVTKCWTIIKQTNSLRDFCAWLEFVSAECFLQKPANTETAWGVIWTVPISDFYKTLHQACSPFTSSLFSCIWLLYCNHQVHRDCLITLYISLPFAYASQWTLINVNILLTVHLNIFIY